MVSWTWLFLIQERLIVQLDIHQSNSSLVILVVLIRLHPQFMHRSLKVSYTELKCPLWAMFMEMAMMMF